MHKLFAIHELDSIHLTDAEPLRFRIELYLSETAGHFSARLLRWESMRLTPSFSNEGDTKLCADYNVLVEDDTLGVADFRHESAEGLLRAVFKRLSETLGIQLPPL
jgi:hypothetical protein